MAAAAAPAKLCPVGRHGPDTTAEGGTTVNDETFDAIATSLARPQRRREAIRRLAGAALGGALGLTALTDADAARKGKRKRRVAEATGTVRAVARRCPPGYDPSTKDPDDLLRDCGTKLKGIEFKLQLPTDSVYTQTQTTGGTTSTAYFPNITPGRVRLKEIRPNKYGRPTVFCGATGPAGQTLSNYDRYDVGNDASVGISMKEHHDFTCDFFQAIPGVLPVGDPPLSPDTLP
jgi:hypothetical protein